MGKKKRGLVVVIVGIIFLITILNSKSFRIATMLNGDSENGTKESIAYLHKDFIKCSEEIKIIDEFIYDENKVVFFSNDDLSGIAKFYKNDKGNYKIGFVETLDSKNLRKISKVL